MKDKHHHDLIQATYDDRERLPQALRGAHRWLTGLPDPNETPPSTGPVRELLKDIGLLGASAASAGILAFTATEVDGAGYALLAPAFIAALAAAGRLRKITVGHMHEAGHGVGFDGWRAKGLSRKQLRALRFRLAEFCSVLAGTQSARAYMKAHGKHHRQPWLGTIYEPDGAELAEDGFVRGLKPGQFYRKLAGKLLNPAWYLDKTKKRMAAGFTQGPISRRIASGAMWAGVFGSLAVLGPAAWTFAIALPWLVLYPAASLLQVITEHPYGGERGASNFAEYAERTWDRIPWDAMPQAGASFGAWAAWSARLALFHIPARLAVLDKTMIWHRYHHIAWPLGRAFDDWWAIAHHAVKAWRDGVLPKGWQANTLAGLPQALERQRVHMETPEH